MIGSDSQLMEGPAQSRGRQVRLPWRWVRLFGGAAILAVLVWRLGTGPFLDGLRTIDGWSLLAATGIAVLTTICSAWRWTLVARGLGGAVPLPAAVGAYYRSQFLNTTLPGGVLGDVHRGVSHGRGVGDVGLGLRAVAWERSAGQVVQAILAVIVLLVMPSPVRSAMPVLGLALLAGTLCVVVLIGVLPHNGASRWARSMRTAARDIGDGLLTRRAWPGIALASTVVVLGHTATFLIAARTAGTSFSILELLPLAFLVLLAMGLPLNIGGWGPREGVAAWAFGMAGLGAAQGVATAVVYGVLVFVATLPGAAVLLLVWFRDNRARPDRSAPTANDRPASADWRPRVTASPQGAAGG